MHTQTRTLAPPEEIIKQATSRHKEKNKRDIRALLARIPITDGVTKIVAVVTFSSLWLLLLLVRSHVSPDPKDLVTTSFVGLAALLQQGAVSGRDFLSNYGLAAQIWAWVATMLTTTKSALNAYAMISFFFGMASAVLIAAVLLICDRISWRECGIVYLFGAVLNLFLDVPNFTSVVLLLIEAFAYRSVRTATVRR